MPRLRFHTPVPNPTPHIQPRGRLMTLLGASAFLALGGGLFAISSWPLVDLVILPWVLERSAANTAKNIQQRTFRFQQDAKSETLLQLKQHFEQHGAGASVLTITGPQGCGKTAAVMEAVASLENPPERVLYLSFKGLVEPMTLCYGVLTQLCDVTFFGKGLMSYTKFYNAVADVLTVTQGTDYIPYIVLSQIYDHVSNAIRNYAVAYPNNALPVVILDDIDGLLSLKTPGGQNMASMILEASLSFCYRSHCARVVLIGRDDQLLQSTTGNVSDTNLQRKVVQRVFPNHISAAKFQTPPSTKLSVRCIPKDIPPSIALLLVEASVGKGGKKEGYTASRMCEVTGLYKQDCQNYLEQLAGVGLCRRRVVGHEVEYFVEEYKEMVGTVPVLVKRRCGKNHVVDIPIHNFSTKNSVYSVLRKNGVKTTWNDFIFGRRRLFEVVGQGQEKIVEVTSVTQLRPYAEVCFA